MSSKPRRSPSQRAKSEPFTPFSGGPPPEPIGHRQARLEHILHDELQSLLTDEATDPSLEGIRLLSVQLSPDAGHARIAYAVVTALDREQQAAHSSKAALARATPFLRARLANLHLKKLPQLSFTFVGVAAAEGGDPCPE